MKRKNLTENNLKTIWDNLDNACGLLDNAIVDLSRMSNLPENIKDSIDGIDFSAIVNLKNNIENLIEKVRENK